VCDLAIKELRSKGEEMGNKNKSVNINDNNYCKLYNGEG
jgi:hypothetical protein